MWKLASTRNRKESPLLGPTRRLSLFRLSDQKTEGFAAPKIADFKVTQYAGNVERRSRFDLQCDRRRAVHVAEAANGICGEIGARMLPKACKQECLAAGKAVIVLMAREVFSFYSSHRTRARQPAAAS